MNQISLSHWTNFNSAVPWGLWVSVYIWLVGISAGSFILVSWGNLKDILSLKKITRWAITLAISTLLVGLLSIQIDLGHMERFTKLFTSPNPGSVMSWMGSLYGFYLLILLVSLVYFRFKKEIPKLFWGFFVVLGLTVLVVESLLLALPPGKQWHSLIFVLHFLTSSLASGLAALILLVGLVGNKEGKKQILKELSKTGVVLVALNLVIEIVDIISQKHFSGLLISLGNVLGIILWLNASWSITLGGLLVLLTTLFSKYNGLISAQLMEPFKGFESAYPEPRLQFSYSPTGFEYLISAGLIGLVVIIFYCLHKIMQVKEV